MSPNFLYADIKANPLLLDRYVLYDWVHAINTVNASTLRGGMLSGCNVRFLFITNIDGNFRVEDEDYKQQGLYRFPANLYYHVLDKWHIDDTAQILMTPNDYAVTLDMDFITRAARKDFRELHGAEPVPVLDTVEWKAKVAEQPGLDNSRTPHQRRF